MELTKAEAETLEALIDNRSLQDVIEGLSDICWAKAQHIRENWPDDKGLIAQWTRACSKLANVSTELSGL